MTPGQRSLPSDSIKVVPGRSKLRVESSNPVARGNPMHKPSKVKLITPEEAINLSTGCNQMPVSPISQPKRKRGRPPLQTRRPVLAPPPPPFEAPRPVPARPPFEVPRPVPARPTSEAPRLVPFQLTSEVPNPKPARPTSEVPSPKPARPTSEAPRLVPFQLNSEVTSPKPARPTSEVPSPKPARPTSEAPRLVPFQLNSEVPSPKPARPTSEVPSPKSARPTSEAPRSVTAHTGSRKEIVCGLRALSLYTQTVRTVRRRTNPSLLQSRMVEPSSPRALQIRARVKQQAANATQVVEGTVVEAANATQVVEGAGSKDHRFKEIRQSNSDEELLELFLHRPARHPTWKGRIVNSATPPEFDCEFCAKPASNIRKKADKLSKAMPMLLKAELLPTGHILMDVFGRTPRLSNVEIYFFPDEQETERVKGEHAHLFEATATRNAMVKVNINGTELLICSSKLLDKASQFLIKAQKKTENFLWGFFLPAKNSIALVPGTSFKDLADGDVADMDLDAEYPTRSVALKLIAETQSTPSRSPGKLSGEVSVPPGFEKKWTPALVKLNIQGTSNTLSDLTGCAGIVRDQSGKWVFGYFRCHKGMPKVVAGLLAMYHGLKTLWDSGIRRIRLETSSIEIINALTTNSDLFPKRRSFLDRCKDIILRNWECDIYLISEEQNSCAEWLASRVEEQPQGLVFFEYPPRALVDLLEKECLAST